MRSYFSGWYYRCQSDDYTLALIPAEHCSDGEKTASIQVITEENTWNIPCPHRPERRGHESWFRFPEGSIFTPEGLRLKLQSPGLSAEGELHFGPLTPLKYDIMGPFRYMPFMECRHSVISMGHPVDGRLCLNGRNYCFHNARGYLEGDRGRSFPRQYAWTQCFFPEGGLMLSVAEIPVGKMRFTGVIAVIRFGGREYRLATYLGARTVKIGGGEIVIRQGSSEFSARLLEKRPQPLRAPAFGAMSRTIHESAVCRAGYRFIQNGQKILDFESDKAAFEYEYPN